MIHHTQSHWRIDHTQILSRKEIALVLDDLKRRGRRSVNSRQNLVVFRLATCCGCRASEVVGLRLQDIKVSVDQPYIYVSKAIGKGKKARKIPLWWDRSTLDDLISWKAERQQQGAQGQDYFVCVQSKRGFGQNLCRNNVRRRFQVGCRVLGADRLVIGEDTYSAKAKKQGQFYLKHLTIHHGRHSFCSHALAGGRSLAEVRDAAGHSDISTVSLYTHIVHDSGATGHLFEFGGAS
jgi:integrase